MAKKITLKPSALSSSTPVEFNPDYSQVKKDLVRIVILAGSIFVVLFVLSFVLPMVMP